MSADLDRLPPHDLAAEQCALGGMLMSAGSVTDVAGILESRDFYRPAHQVIFEAILRLYERGAPADAVTVAHELVTSGQITRTGGHPYLHDLIAAVPTAANAGWYARIVLDHARRRRIIEAGERIAQLGESADGIADEIAERARAELDDATSGHRTGELRSMADLTDAVIESLEKETERGLPTGWADLDGAILGLAPGQLILVAARPGTGKSIIGASVAHHAGCALGEPALLSSLEMTAEEITARLLSAEARIPLTHLLERQLSDSEWIRLANARPRLLDSRLVIDYDPSASITSLRARLDSMARTGPAKLLVVDYLGLLAGPGAENRQQEVAAVSRALKRIAGDYQIPVVACAQLNRNPEGRAGKRPQMSDLRDSGAQEQDADVVILLHREDAGSSAPGGEIKLHVAKQRQGAPATVKLAFLGEYTRCADLAWTPSSALEHP